MRWWACHLRGSHPKTLKWQSVSVAERVGVLRMDRINGKNERHSERRATYEYVPWDSARFIVPLLCDAIGRAISDLPAVPSAPMRVVDLGCGSQPFRRHLEAAGYTYLSVDAIQNGAGNVDFLAFLDKPLPTELQAVGPVDLILCTEVLEHVADWHQAFRNIHSLLKPGGRAIISCPFLYPLHEQPHDYWRPTRYALRHFAAAYGFEIVRQEQLGDFWDALGTVIGSLGLDGFARRQSAGGRRRITLSLANFRLLLLKVARRVFLLILSGRHLRRVLRFHSPIYISNFAIMQRQ